MVEDFHLVNVSYRPGNAAPTVTFPNVLDLAHCPASGDGWYYDDNAAPTEIILCPASCDTLVHDLTAELDIVLGCQTLTN